MDTQEQNLDAELQDAQNLDEELELELEDQVQEPTVTGSGKKRFEDMTHEELLMETKKYYGIATKKASPVQKRPKTPNSKSTEELQEIRETVNKLSLAEQKRQFQYENNLSPEQTDKVFAITSKPTKETLEDPFVKAGLEAIRQQQRVSEATPSPSGRSATHNGKTFKDMTPDERQAAMDARFKR